MANDQAEKEWRQVCYDPARIGHPRTCKPAGIHRSGLGMLQASPRMTEWSILNDGRKRIIKYKIGPAFIDTFALPASLENVMDMREACDS